MADEQQYNPIDAFLSDINVKLRDIEEKQNIIKDRVLLIGENLISEKEEIDEEMSLLKTDIMKMTEELKRFKLALERVFDDMNNFVRKNEFEILQRQFQMFQPMELARISDVEEMIRSAMSKIKK